MANPWVTVIISTYHWSSVLPFSIGSVLRQTFADFELLVVGDGCTDDSHAVVADMGDARVRWINLPKNTGHQSGPNNEGLRQARGELIAYLGHDDLWLPHHLALAVAAIDAGADLTYSITAMIAPGDAEPSFEPSEMEHYEPGLWIPPTCVVHRRSLSEQAGGWRNFCELNQDPEADLWERMRAVTWASRPCIPGPKNTGETPMPPIFQTTRFQYIRRLTAIKFPAIWRKGSYKTQRCNEQAAWFDRIGREPDLEAVELAKLLKPIFEDGRSTMPFREVLKDFRADLFARCKRKLIRWRILRAQDRAAFLKARRKFKGLTN